MLHPTDPLHPVDALVRIERLATLPASGDTREAIAREARRAIDEATSVLNARYGLTCRGMTALAEDEVSGAAIVTEVAREAARRNWL